MFLWKTVKPTILEQNKINSKSFALSSKNGDLMQKSQKGV